MKIVTTETVPGYEIKDVVDTIYLTSTVEVSNKGLIRSFLERDRNETQEIMNQFVQSVPNGVNAIVGFRINTTSQAFSNKVLMYYTLYGTAVVIEKK